MIAHQRCVWSRICDGFIGVLRSAILRVVDCFILRIWSIPLIFWGGCGSGVRLASTVSGVRLIATPKKQRHKGYGYDSQEDTHNDQWRPVWICCLLGDAKSPSLS
jgi:hypothetical protein